MVGCDAANARRYLTHPPICCLPSRRPCCRTFAWPQRHPHRHLPGVPPMMCRSGERTLTGGKLQRRRPACHPPVHKICPRVPWHWMPCWMRPCLRFLHCLSPMQRRSSPLRCTRPCSQTAHWRGGRLDRLAILSGSRRPMPGPRPFRRGQGRLGKKRLLRFGSTNARPATSCQPPSWVIRMWPMGCWTASGRQGRCMRLWSCCANRLTTRRHRPASESEGRASRRRKTNQSGRPVRHGKRPFHRRFGAGPIGGKTRRWRRLLLTAYPQRSKSTTNPRSVWTRRM